MDVATPGVRLIRRIEIDVRMNNAYHTGDMQTYEYWARQSREAYEGVHRLPEWVREMNESENEMQRGQGDQ